MRPRWHWDGRIGQSTMEPALTHRKEFPIDRCGLPGILMDLTDQDVCFSTTGGPLLLLLLLLETQWLALLNIRSR